MIRYYNDTAATSPYNRYDYLSAVSGSTSTYGIWPISLSWTEEPFKQPKIGGKGHSKHKGNRMKKPKPHGCSSYRRKITLNGRVMKVR
jgi:hypothetical protein